MNVFYKISKNYLKPTIKNKVKFKKERIELYIKTFCNILKDHC